MLVYCATNSHNGKKYVGITTQSFAQRKREHYNRMVRNERQHKFYHALRRYGFDNFTWEVLETFDNKEALRSAECSYISEFNSYHRGYNSTPGGDIVTDATRELISRKLKNRIVTWGHKSKQTRLENGTYFGRPGSKGANNPKAKSYLVTAPDGTHEVITGIRQFCREQGLSHNLLLSVASGKQTHHKGYKCEHYSEPSTTIPQGSTSQAIGDGNGERP